MQLWQTPAAGRGPEVRELLSRDSSPATCAAFSPDGTFLVVEGGERGCVTQISANGKERCTVAVTGLPNGLAVDSAGFIWVADDFGFDRVDWIRYLAFITTLFAGITMVVTIPFYSFKDFNLRKRVQFWVVPAVIGSIAVIGYKPKD